MAFSVLGAGIAATGALMSSMSSTALNYGLNKKTAERAFEYNSALQSQQYWNQRKLNRNAYQDAVFSMRNAGINPMLAISNGASAGSASGGGSVSVNPTEADLSGAVSSNQHE